MISVEELIEAKKAQKITLDEISARSGIAKRTIEDIFRGATKHPRVDTMQAIERALGLDAPAPEVSKETQQLFTLLNELTEDELVELSSFVDFIISKRK